MLGVVVQIDGFDPVLAQPITLRAASHDDAAVCHAGGGEPSWPALIKLPTLRYDLFDGAFGGEITAPSSSLTIAAEPWPNFGRYALADARLRLWTGAVGAPWASWTLRFDGRVSEQPELADGIAAINFAVDDRWLDRALLETYAGTSGAEGTEALKGQPKPLALGAPRYVSGTLVNNIDTVFQLSAYGRVRGFEAALERLARFGNSVGDFASYAALVAADVPAGRWATARTVGMARLGAPPTGQVSFLVGGDDGGPDGWARLPGAIIRRLALLSGGAGKVNDASLNALDAARPYNQSIYVDQQTTARQLIQQVAASVNAVAGMSWTGQLFVVPVGIGAAGLTLAADGSALPAVTSVKQVGIASPFQKLAIGAARAWTVHPLSDIAFTAPLLDLGTYVEGTTYREGNIVNLEDGSRWLYVATAASAGQPPAVGSAYWAPLSGPVRATYDDGTPIDDLKPAQPGSDVTGDNTSKDTNAVGGKPANDLLKSIDDLEKVTIPAVNAAVGEANAAIAAAVQQAATAVADTNARITAATQVTDAAAQAAAEGIAAANDRVAAAEVTLDRAVSDLAAEVARAQGKDEELLQRIDSLAAEGGYDDTTVRALIERAETARADGDRALANRIDTVVTSYQDLDTATNALITQQVAVLSSADQALGQRIDSVTADYQGRDVATNTRITDTATALANAEEAIGQRITAVQSGFTSGGGNLLSNTDFVTTDGWGENYNVPRPDYGINAAGAGYHPVGENVLSISQTGRAGGDAYYADWISDPVAVVPGSFVQFWAMCASHRANTQAFLGWVGTDGVIFAFVNANLNSSTERLANDPALYKRSGLIAIEVPAQAVAARLLMRKGDTYDGQGDSYAWFWRPYIGGARQGQNAWNDWSPGSARAVQTATDARVATSITTLADADRAIGQRIDSVTTDYKSRDVTTNTRITDTATALADADGALGRRIDSVTADYQGRDVATNARVTDTATAFAAADQALGQRIDSVTADYKGRDTTTNARITDTATALTDAKQALGQRIDAVQSSFTSGGGNLLSNTDFVTTDGWGQNLGMPLPSYGINAGGDLYHPVGENVLSIYQEGRAGGEAYADWMSDPVAVVGGSFMQFSAMFASHRADTQAFLGWVGSDGVIFAFVNANRNTSTEQFANDPNLFKRSGVLAVEVPLNAVAARLLMRKNDTYEGQGNSFAWFWRPYIGAARAGQNSWNDWSPGKGRAVQIASDARVATSITTLADADRAIGQRIDSVVADYQGRDVKTNARVDGQATALADARQALGQRIDTVGASIGPAVNAKAEEITTAYTTADEALGRRATSLEAQASPSGGNLVPNSALSTLDGWRLTENREQAGTVGRNAAGTAFQLGGVENNLTLVRGPAGTGSLSSGLPEIEVQSAPFAVRPGSTLQFYALTASHRSRGWTALFFFDGDDGFIGTSGSDSVGARINVGGQDLNAWDITGRQTVVVPINATKARFVARQYDVSNDGYYWLSRPFATEVKPGTNTWVPYSAGNDRPVTAATSARISDIDSVIADLPNRYAAASRTAALEAQVNFAADSGLQRTVNARIEDRANAIADSKAGAVAQTVSQLRGEYNGTAATVSQQAGAIVDLQGKASAYVRVTADAGNGVAQLSLWSDQYGGAWELVGNGRIRGNLFVDGTVTTEKVAANAINAGVAIVGGSKAFTTGYTVIAEANYTVSSAASQIVVSVSGTCLVSSGAVAGTYANLQVAVNGQVLLTQRVGSRGNLSQYTFLLPTSGLSGACNFQMSIGATASNGQGDPHTVDRPTIIVQEFKK